MAAYYQFPWDMDAEADTAMTNAIRAELAQEDPAISENRPFEAEAFAQLGPLGFGRIKR